MTMPHPEAGMTEAQVEASLAHHLENQRMLEIVHAYEAAYAEFAGPSQFRHSVNFDTYHRAGLIGVWNKAIASRRAVADAEPVAWINAAGNVLGVKDRIKQPKWVLEEFWKDATPLYASPPAQSPDSVVSVPREGLDRLRKWNEKYPAGRIYNYDSAVAMEHELQDAIRLLTAAGAQK